MIWTWTGQSSLRCVRGERSRGECSVTPGLVLGPEWYRQELYRYSIRWAKAVGRYVAMKQVCKEGVKRNILIWICCMTGSQWRASGGQQWCGNGSRGEWAGIQQSPGCTEVYLEHWMMYQNECCCSSQFWMWCMPKSRFQLKRMKMMNGGKLWFFRWK